MAPRIARDPITIELTIHQNILASLSEVLTLTDMQIMLLWQTILPWFENMDSVKTVIDNIDTMNMNYIIAELYVVCLEQHSEWNDNMEGELSLGIHWFFCTSTTKLARWGI